MFLLALIEVPVVPVHIALIKVLLVLYTQHCRGGCGYSVMQNTGGSMCCLFFTCIHTALVLLCSLYVWSFRFHIALLEIVVGVVSS